MPEGHLLHRFAREQSADLAGHPVSASSPQGRFDASAVDGGRLLGAEAHGKHLFDRFEGGLAVHIHLGMRGIYLRHPDAAAPPRAGVRLRLAGPVAWDLIAPTTCEVLDEDGVAAVRARLGPDPLRDDADEGDAVARLRAAPGAVGAALVDQAVWAGVGNAWRAELLYLARLDPRLPCARLTAEQAAGLWDSARTLLALGRDLGQVVSDAALPDERWVYKRETCRGCGAPVRTGQVGGRTSYACPVEQLAGA